MSDQTHDSPLVQAARPAGCCRRPWWPAALRGFAKKCPKCGNSHLFSSYLEIHTSCPECGEELHHHRTSDLPAICTVFLVGHILLISVLTVRAFWDLDLATHLMIWIPSSIILTLFLLPRIKGAFLGFQWALCMHGFEFSALNQQSARQQGENTD